MNELEVLNEEVLAWIKELSESKDTAREIIQIGLNLRKRVLEQLDKAKMEPSGAGIEAAQQIFMQNADLVNEKIWELIYQGKFAEEHLETSLLEITPLKAAYPKVQAVTAARCAVCSVCTACSSLPPVSESELMVLRANPYKPLLAVSKLFKVKFRPGAVF